MGRYKLHPTRFLSVGVVILAAICLILWGAWCGAAWAKDKLALQLLDVQFLTWGDNIQTTPVEVIVIRQEETVKAPAAGKLRLLVDHGDRLRAGAPLAEITGTTTRQVSSPAAGIFCTDLDGLEHILAPDLVDALDLESLETTGGALKLAGDEVSSGELIGKLVDNLQPALIYFHLDDTEANQGQVWQSGAPVYFIFNGQQLKGMISEVRLLAEGLGLLVELEKYPDDFVHQRHHQMELINREVSGYIVPEQALVFKDGSPGLYLVLKKRIKWQPVTARDRLGGKLTVTGENLDDAVRYVQNPRWAKEGAVLNK